MSGVASPRGDEPGRMTGARGEFVSSLQRRLETLRASLAALEQLPGDPERQNGLLRRLHALGSASRVLGFASVAEALAAAEKSLRGALMSGKLLPLADVARTLDLLPSLAGATGDDAEPSGRARTWPMSVLVFGPSSLADALGGHGANVECERTEDPTRARELSRIIGPDVAVIDADRRGAREIVELFAQDQLVEPVPVLVVGSFETESAAPFIELGAARVMSKPVSPESLWRAVSELRALAAQPKPPREPLGQLTVPALVDRIAEELRRGLADAVEPSAQGIPVAFGEGADVLAAVWGAVARVRELVTLRSQGGVRFQGLGPEGAVPVAPWGGEERRAGDRTARAYRSAEDVSLQGRRILVADDDPAVVWFMSGLLKAVGADVLEAHNGRRALEIVHEQFPDAVISDVLMPELNGFSLCHEIKRDVAVRDTPVILLSWKEDLLQRLRELGADADGYLRKEAAASAVVERVREVLRARARVEQRVSGGGEVRGRLDGLTVRLLLQMVCQNERDARVAVRDAVYLWELAVRGGRLMSITRSSATGDFSRGPAVLPGLLGVSAGRFTIEPDSAPTRTEFQGELADVLHEPIARARAALRAVAADALVRISQMTFDRASVEPYLSCTPEPALSLTMRLLEGASPRDLVVEGDADPRLLETVLSDLARRGAIYSVEREAGASLFPPASLAERVVAPPPGEELSWEEELSDEEVAPALASPAPAVRSEQPATPPEHEPVAVRAERLEAHEAMPFNSQVTPADWTAGPLFAFGPEHGTLPGVGGGLPIVRSLEVESEPPPNAPYLAREPEPRLMASEQPYALADDAGRPSALALQQAVVNARVERPRRPEAEESDELELSAFVGVSETPAPVPAAAQLARADDLDAELSMLVGLGESSGPPPVVEPKQQEEEAPEVLVTAEEAEPEPELEAKPEPEPSESEPPPAKFEVQPVQVSSAPPARVHSPLSEPPAVPSSPLTTEELLAALTPQAPEAAPEAAPQAAKLESLKRTAMDGFTAPAPAQAPELSEEDHEEEDDEEERERAAEEARARARVTERPSVARVRTKPEEARREPRASERTAHRAGEPASKNWLTTAILTVASFAGVYTVVTYLFTPGREESAAVESAVPVAPAPPVPAAKPAPAAPQPKVEVLPLPTGIDVQNGLGLLEVEIAGSEALYVDGDIIGRGPVRRVPLKPGRHELVIGEGAERQVVGFDVSAGARSRVTLAAQSP